MNAGANKQRALCVAAAMIFMGCVVLSLFKGATTGFDPQIFWLLRIPRTVSGVAVGGGLAVAGVLIQASLGNPLADPYTVGIASASALGAVLGSLFPADAFFGSSVLALVFGLGTLGLLSLWLRGGYRQPTEVLLVGVIASFFFTAVATLVLALADPAQWSSALTWLMGQLGRTSLSQSAAAFLVVAFVSALGWAHWKPLDLMAVDDLSARSAGVDTQSLRKRLFVLVAVITAICVSTAGIIGFVGLIVPHFLRRLGMSSHFYLIPAAFLAGSGLLLGSDVMARLVVRPSEIPVGVVTALIGAPCFLWLARGRLE